MLKYGVSVDQLFIKSNFLLEFQTWLAGWVRQCLTSFESYYVRLEYKFSKSMFDDFRRFKPTINFIFS